MIRRNIIISFAAVAVFATAALVAGPLSPPAGPVTSTYKTLTEVEPRIAINATNTPGTATSLFKITAPGSYYLTGNITGVVGKHGIEIAASGVTLDLNGFNLVGVPAMGFLDGVNVTVTGLSNIAVVNGSVRSWGDDGVDFATASATNCRVEGLLVSGNTGSGIVTYIGCTVTKCSAYSNQVIGISASFGCTVTDCTSYSNQNVGISTGGGCTIANCSSYGNQSIGIRASNACTLLNCTAYQNAGDGISVDVGSAVEGCTARVNTLDGIQCNSQCVIRGNTCSNNGDGAAGDGAGIHALGTDNRIEGNNCTSADRGIDVDVAGNIIIRNTCSGNTTNWDIVASNYYGPIIDRTGVVTAAVNGPAAVSTLGTTDANANFSY